MFYLADLSTQFIKYFIACINIYLYIYVTVYYFLLQIDNWFGAFV